MCLNLYANIILQTYSVCAEPPEAGECDNRTTAWFYDSENMACTAFTYTGCGGNGNRFETRDQCERQCGEFKGVGKFGAGGLGTCFRCYNLLCQTFAMNR